MSLSYARVRVETLYVEWGDEFEGLLETSSRKGKISRRAQSIITKFQERVLGYTARKTSPFRKVEVVTGGFEISLEHGVSVGAIDRLAHDLQEIFEKVVNETHN